RFGLTVGASTAVTGLPTLSTGLSRKLRILREAALLIGDALSALTTCYGGELPILRKTALLSGGALSAFTACLRRPPPVLREAALLIRHGLAAHTGDLPLALLIHRSESAIRSTAVLSWYVSHY